MISTSTPLVNVINYGPNASFVTFLNGLNVTVDDTSTDPNSGTPLGDSYNYIWNFGDGTVVYGHTLLIGNDRTHAYAAPGTYTVGLNLTDAFNASSLFSKLITVISGSTGGGTSGGNSGGSSGSGNFGQGEVDGGSNSSSYGYGFTDYGTTTSASSNNANLVTMDFIPTQNEFAYAPFVENNVQSQNPQPQYNYGYSNSAIVAVSTSTITIEDNTVGTNTGTSSNNTNSYAASVFNSFIKLPKILQAILFIVLIALIIDVLLAVFRK